MQGIITNLKNKQTQTLKKKKMKTIKKVNKEGNWLSFPENKPEQFSWVLVTIKSPIDKWVEMAGFDGEKFQLPGRGDTSYVTHWMPIPEPAC